MSTEKGRVYFKSTNGNRPFVRVPSGNSRVHVKVKTNDEAGLLYFFEPQEADFTSSVTVGMSVDGSSWEEVTGNIYNTVDLSHFASASTDAQNILEADLNGTPTELTGTVTSYQGNAYDLSEYEQISRFGELAVSTDLPVGSNIFNTRDAFHVTGLKDAVAEDNILFVISDGSFGSSSTGASYNQAVIEISEEEIDPEIGCFAVDIPLVSFNYAFKLLRRKTSGGG